MAHGTFEDYSLLMQGFKLHQFTEGVKVLMSAKEIGKNRIYKWIFKQIVLSRIRQYYRIKILEITGKERNLNYENTWNGSLFFTAITKR